MNSAAVAAEIASIPTDLGDPDPKPDPGVHFRNYSGGSVVRPESSRPPHVTSPDKPIVVSMSRLVDENDGAIERCLWIGSEDALDPDQWLDLAVSAATAAHKAGLLGEYMPVPLPMSDYDIDIVQGSVIGGYCYAAGGDTQDGRYEVVNYFARDEDGQDVGAQINVYDDSDTKLWSGDLTPEQAIELAGHLITSAVAVRVHAEREAGGA